MLQRSGLHEAQRKREFKEYYGVFCFGQRDSSDWLLQRCMVDWVEIRPQKQSRIQGGKT